ncbi:MAG: bactofilin family protein [Methyloligellaceae bacterium]
MFSKDSSSKSDKTSKATPEVEPVQQRIERPRASKPGMPSIVSEGLHVTGNMISDGDIQIDGIVEGDVKGGKLIVGVNGGVIGKVIANEVTVNGAVTGEIKAASVILAKSAKVQGNITHESLSIEAGAEFEGQCKRGDGAARQAASNDSTKQVLQQLSGSQSDNQSGSQSGSQSGGSSGSGSKKSA